MFQHQSYPHDESQEQRLPVEALRDLVRQLLIKHRMFPGDAQVVADRMVEADLRGIPSHGCATLKRNLVAIDAADIDPRAELTTEADTPAMAVLNGGSGMGHVAATRAMELAIRKGAAVGVGTVVVKKSQHYGCCGLYPMMAAAEGMIGYTTTNTGRPNVLAYGSSAGAECNHGVAWAVPVRSGAPIVVDMAVAASSWGKIQTLAEYGLPMPDGWAVDASGQMTTDPGAASLLMPMAGPRGFGMALISSALTGGLAGGKFPIDKPRAVEVEGGEHFFQAIDVKRFVKLDRFYDRVASACDQIRALPPAAGFGRVTLPGELEWELAAARRESGIPLHRSVAAELVELARRNKVEVPWTD